MGNWGVALITWLFAFGSLAKEEVKTTNEEVKTIKEPDRVVYKKKTEIDFSDVAITGDLMKPDAAYAKVRKNEQFQSLIKLRSNFRPELRKSASELEKERL